MSGPANFPCRRTGRPIGAILVVLLAACAGPGAMAPDADPIRAAFVVLGEGGSSIARVITTDPACPPVDVDGQTLATTIRAVPETMPLRPTKSTPAESKPSAFPVLVCERRLPAGATRASVGGHTLPLLRHDARRIVVVGDTGCVVQNAGFQPCNDAAGWPFARLAAAAAAQKPDLVIHVGDYHYREIACPDGNSKCSGSPWGYGWDAWAADFFAPARDLLAAAPWVFVRGNHESCSRAGQGWWRFLDPRPLVNGRDCVDAANDPRGDYSDPYAVPLSVDTQLIVFDSSRVGVAPLAADDPMYAIYSVQVRRAMELAGGAAHNFFVDHHPILGFATDTTRRPAGVYPGNAALQSVLAASNGPLLFPPGIDALLSGHNHLFEAVGFATGQPPQFIAGNGGTWLDEPLPRPLPAGATPAVGAVVATISSSATFGFLTLQRDPGAAAAWRVEARDRDGRLLTRCVLFERRTTCVPEDLQ
ncbi:MAG TPA: metallophosphoesterase [Casimicrobiaceae bacterium]|nr:metallophosphoesterase [Casimicrobiaceae bacterium]